MIGRAARRLRAYDLDRLDNRDEVKLARWIEAWEPRLRRYFRAEVRGIERVPGGPALFVGNHNGGFVSADTLLLGCALYRHGGTSALPYALGHELAWSLPFVNRLGAALGVIRASHDNAARAFALGAKVLVYPGGDLENMRPFRDRNRIVFGARTGYVRLALRESVPMVPVVAAGAHSTLLILDDGRWLAERIGARRLFRTEVWPIALSMPWGLTIGPILPYVPFPARVLVEVLEPIRFARTGPDAAEDTAYVRRCADEVERAMQLALTRLAAEL